MLHCVSSFIPVRTATSTIYEDDGSSFDYRRGEWMKLEMSWRDKDRRLSLRLAARSKMLGPSRRPLVIRLAGSPEEKTVVFEGRPQEVRL